MLTWVATALLQVLRLLRPVSATAEAAISMGINGSAAAADTVPHHRSYFYTGGQYVNTSAGSVFQGQMYVERLTPADVPADQLLAPIIFIHGGGQTGTNFLNTPDGRPGWSSFFLARRHPVYLVDQPYRGRSPWTPRGASDTLTSFPAEDVERRFTAPERQRQRLWPQASLHTQWPAAAAAEGSPGGGGGGGVRGDAVFDAYFASTVPNPYADDLGVTERAFRTAVTDLLRRWIGQKSFVVGHSQGGLMAWQAADAVPELVRGVVALEPMGPPFVEQVFGWREARPYGLGNAPLAYEPPVVEGSAEEVRAQFQLVTRKSGDPAVANCTLQAEGDGKVPRKLAQISKVPVLLVTAEASYHAVYDWCTAEFLRQAGVAVEHVSLEDRGVRGNAHLFFMEKNNLDSAAVVDEWVREKSPSNLVLHDISEI